MLLSILRIKYICSSEIKNRKLFHSSDTPLHLLTIFRNCPDQIHANLFIVNFHQTLRYWPLHHKRISQVRFVGQRRIKVPKRKVGKIALKIFLLKQQICHHAITFNTLFSRHFQTLQTKFDGVSSLVLVGENLKLRSKKLYAPTIMICCQFIEKPTI